MDDEKYYLIRKRAVPDVLLKVLEVRRMLEADEMISVNEATEQVGISRSSFYKYKDDIVPFNEKAKGKNVTFLLNMDDTPGCLSKVLLNIAQLQVNVLTIHQSIPVNGIATVTLSLEIPGNFRVERLEENIRSLSGIYKMQIMAMEYGAETSAV